MLFVFFKIPAKADSSLLYKGVEDKNTLRRCSSGVERFLGKEEVLGSNPNIGSNRKYIINTDI